MSEFLAAAAPTQLCAPSTDLCKEEGQRPARPVQPQCCWCRRRRSSGRESHHLFTASRTSSPHPVQTSRCLHMRPLAAVLHQCSLLSSRTASAAQRPDDSAQLQADAQGVSSRHTRQTHCRTLTDKLRGRSDTFFWLGINIQTYTAPPCCSMQGSTSAVIIRFAASADV